MRSVRTILIVALCSALLASCFTGKRAHFADAAPAVEDPAIAAVLARLEAPTPTPYTATYNVLTRFGNINSAATVAQTSALDRSTTVGTVRFLEQPDGSQTCQLTSATCAATIDDAQISNLSMTHDFAKISPAARLRQDAQVMSGAAIPSTKEVAGQVATCVQVAFAEGTKEYCALDGLLAYQLTPDLEVTMLSLAPTADPALFTTSTIPPNG